MDQMDKNKKKRKIRETKKNKKQRYGSITLFGKEIMKYRMDKNLTRKEMAKEIGISTSSLGCIEDGHRGIKEEVFEKISEFMGLDFYEKIKLKKLYERSLKSIKINLSEIPFEPREIIFYFYKNWNNMSGEEIKKIKDIFQEYDGWN